MGTGKYINFGDGDDSFNIALDSTGNLSFLANTSTATAIAGCRSSTTRTRSASTAESPSMRP
jgi:hypothetical protein